MGAATEIARALSVPHHHVRIVASDFGYGVCPLYKDAFDYTLVKTPKAYRIPEYFWQSRRVDDAIADADIVIACKAYANTVFPALRAQKRGAKAVVYLDEWDGAVWKQYDRKQKMNRILNHVMHPLDSMYHPWVERFIPKADLIVGTSTFLKNKFGAEIIPMGVDMDLFAPRPIEIVAALKKRLDLENKKVLVFGGVVRPHKGLNLLFQAIQDMHDAEVCLLVAGPETSELRKLMKVFAMGDRVRCTGAVSKHEMPDYLAVADAVVIPQQNSLLGNSQVPCKVFEAMAMAKPVIAAATSDLPRILDKIGELFVPNSAADLGRALQEVLSDKTKAKKMGHAVRKACEHMYSAGVIRKRWMDCLHGLMSDGIRETQ